MSKEKEKAELVQKITQKIFSKSSIDRDEVRSMISKIFKDYKVELKREVNE